MPSVELIVEPVFSNSAGASSLGGGRRRFFYHRKNRRPPFFAIRVKKMTKMRILVIPAKAGIQSLLVG